MARGGLYKSDVQKARATLIAQGVNPSLDALRVALGNTGSKSTIHRFLKELEEEEGAGVGAKVAVSEALQDLVGRLAERLHEEAEALVTEAKRQCDTKLHASSEALGRQQLEIAALSTQLQRTESELQAERDQTAATMQSLSERTLAAAQLEERIVGLTTRLAEHESHAKSLEEKHQHAREALEHYRTSVKEQRDQEQRRHEHQVQGLQVELRQAQEGLTAKNHELMQLSRDNAQMTVQLGQAERERGDAREERRKLEHEISELKGKVQDQQTLESCWAKELKANEELRSEAEVRQAALEAERERRRQAEADFLHMGGRLQALEEVLSRVQSAPAPKKEKPDKSVS